MGYTNTEGWTAVTEKLPELRTPVLVAENGATTIAVMQLGHYAHGDVQEFIEVSSHVIVKPDFWRELPAPPAKFTPLTKEEIKALCLKGRIWATWTTRAKWRLFAEKPHYRAKYDDWVVDGTAGDYKYGTKVCGEFPKGFLRLKISPDGVCD